MKNFIMQLFNETGTVSMMRMLSLICVLTASAIALYCIYMNRDMNAASILCGIFLGAAFTGKAVQKISEVKERSNGEK